MADQMQVFTMVHLELWYCVSPRASGVFSPEWVSISPSSLTFPQAVHMLHRITWEKTHVIVSAFIKMGEIKKWKDKEKLREGKRICRLLLLFVEQLCLLVWAEKFTFLPHAFINFVFVAVFIVVCESCYWLVRHSQRVNCGLKHFQLIWSTSAWRWGGAQVLYCSLSHTQLPEYQVIDVTPKDALPMPQWPVVKEVPP